MQILRSTRRHTMAAALLAGSSLLVVTPAAAQDDGGDIIVTAQKREQNLQDVAASVTALGNEKLDELQVNELADLVKYLPSVTIQSTGPGFSQVYFRGVASGENANHSTSLPTVGTYLDEMPITTIQGALDIHTYDLARVEALAGPQGTLYGASSMAGTIKMVTNKPDTGSNYGAADFELNQVNHGGVGGIAEGFYNFALSDSAAARIVAWYRRDAGYIDNIPGSRVYPSLEATYGTALGTQNNDEFAKDDYNDVETYGARLALGIELNDSWTIRPTVMGQVMTANGNFAQERSNAVNDDYQTVQYNREYSKDKWLQAALTIEGQIGSWDLVATGGHLWRDDETFQDYSDYAYFYDSYYFSSDPTSGYLVYDNNGDQVSPNQYVEGTDKYRRLFGELRVSSPADAPLRFIGGVFGQRQVHFITQHYVIDDIDDTVQVAGTDDNIWLTAQKRVDRDLAAFGELTFDLTDKLSVTGGGRVYYYKNSLEGFFGFQNPGNSGNPQYLCQDAATVPGAPCNNLNKTTSDTGFIHKLNVTYKINEDALVYATWSRGFRPGGINRRSTLPPYGPDTLDNYEIGWKTQFGPVTFNGAIYQENWKNIQLSFLGANGLTEIRSAGIARIRGVEADFTYRRDGLTLGLSGSYNDSKITEDFCAIANPEFDCTIDVDLDNSGAIDDSSEENSTLAPAGTQLPVTPKFKGTALARYEFPIGDWKGHFQVAVSHTGERRNDLRTAENAFAGDLDAYTTADISLGFKTDTYRVEAFATNLFGSKGVVNTGTQCIETICGDPDGFTAGGGVFYDTLIKPRVIGIKVGADF